MAQDETEYTIHEAAARLGIPLQKLRRWDAQGVLVARRTDGGHRRYAREIIDGLASSSVLPREDKHNDELAQARKSLKEKRRIIQLLLESESRYRDLVETSHDLIWTTDSLGRFTYLNNGCVDIFGLQPKELIGRCFFDFEAKPSHISNRRFLSTLRRNGEVKDYLTHLVAGDGTDRWVGINARVSHDDDGRIVGLRGTARNITEQHRAALQIEHLATHDSLTGLPNRVSLQRTLEAALASGEKGAVLQFDVDHFKYVNDNFGHKAGDQLLIAIGGVLKDRNAQVFRLGGDEFAVHLPDALRADAVQTAELALDALRRFTPQMADDACLSTLSASIGIATYPFQGGDVATLLANIDIAMYQAKDDGRNRYVLHDTSSEELRATHRRVHWARELREVLDEDRVVIWSQPMVRVADRKVVAHEVLVRIVDGDGEIVLPGQFMEIAEELGLAQEIDTRVVSKLLAWMASPEHSAEDMHYFVNLSRSSIADAHWVRRFLRMLSTANVDHRRLVFEITETDAMADVDVTQQFIGELRQLGCRFALDDFGAGFSSFYYVKRFDVDYLKIDGGFVQELERDEAAKLFVRALCDVAKGLDKQVIAEWVESAQALEILSRMGAQYAQGNLFAVPRPLIPEASEIEADEARRA
jgi:diguanylate cyclase (GGDEF)-like protein/PAS domain S-box-containing protein/excisionase family DNA binding protein